MIKRIKYALRKAKVLIIFGMIFSILILLFMYPYIVVTLYSGEEGVLYKRFSGGTVTDKMLGEGIHLIWPWDIVYVYNVRIQEKKHSLEILSKNGLTVKLDMSIRYQPDREFLGVLHKTVGPDYADKIVVPQVESVLRAVIGQYYPEEIFTTKRGILETAVLRSFLEVSEKYVTLDAVVLRRVELPKTVKDAIESKLKQQQLALEYEFRLDRETKEAERKRIEAGGISEYQKIVRESLTKDLLTMKGIAATEKLAESPNSKLIIIGGKDGLPIILNTDDKR